MHNRNSGSEAAAMREETQLESDADDGWLEKWLQKPLQAMFGSACSCSAGASNVPGASGLGMTDRSQINARGDSVDADGNASSLGPGLPAVTSGVYVSGPQSGAHATLGTGLRIVSAHVGIGTATGVLLPAAAYYGPQLQPLVAPGLRVEGSTGLRGAPQRIDCVFGHALGSVQKGGGPAAKTHANDPYCECAVKAAVQSGGGVVVYTARGHGQSTGWEQSSLTQGGQGGRSASLASGFLRFPIHLLLNSHALS
jgi:hypothetical protein